MLVFLFLFYQIHKYCLKYNPLVGSRYIKLSKELNDLWKRIINIQNIDDNECFKWSIVKTLNLTGHNPRRITKADKNFAKNLDFKETQSFSAKLEIHKKLKKRIPLTLVFSVFKIKQNIQSMYQKNVVKKNMLLLIGKEGKRHYILIKNFNTFLYDHTLYRGRKPLLFTSFQYRRNIKTTY